MGFFDTIGKKASEAYDATAKKTGELAKEAKLKMKINEDKSDINDLNKEIGKKVYEKHVEGNDLSDYTLNECEKIDEISKDIEECLNSIRELKDKKQCPNCHTEIDINAEFCPKCGERQPVAEVEKIEVEVKEAEVVTEEKSEEEPKEEQSADSNENQNNE